jgi:hypothetical protein
VLHVCLPSPFAECLVVSLTMPSLRRDHATLQIQQSWKSQSGDFKGVGEEQLMTLYPYTHATYVPQEDVIEEGVPNPPEPHAGLPAMQMELVTQVKSVRNLPNLRDGGNGSHYMVELSFMGKVQRTMVTERNETYNHVHFKERFSFAVHEMTIGLARAAKSSGCDGPTLVVSVYDCGRCDLPVPSFCVAMRYRGLHELPVRATCATLCSPFLPSKWQVLSQRSCGTMRDCYSRAATSRQAQECLQA